MYGSIKYSTNKYASNKNISDEQIKPYTPDLMKYLPKCYRKSKVMANIETTNAKELGRLYYLKKDLLKQFFIDTATWGLTLWEEDYGIKTDLNKSYEDRREVIKAKKRGQGTVTKKMLKEVAEAFSGGECEIIEHPESYSFTVKFIGIKGIPINLAAFIDMLNIIKPAHLAYDFEYTYSIWSFLKGSKLTWSMVNTKMWKELKAYDN
ncbi:YmfQ family protein [Clostridium oceanicum]|uniref:Phage portal protein n=1 Tax=Clostridium oceanicum TaxID=1543 RepID=A0ABN1JCH6_9CLOT